VTRTIDERVEAAIDELQGMLMQRNQLCRNILARHFAEPWLDVPDGPGWWGRQTANMKPIPVELRNHRGALCIEWNPIHELAVSRWQRVIGPSE